MLDADILQLPSNLHGRSCGTVLECERKRERERERGNIYIYIHICIYIYNVYSMHIYESTSELSKTTLSTAFHSILVFCIFLGER